MTNFDRWAGELADSLNKEQKCVSSELDLGDLDEETGLYMWPCRGCGNYTEVHEPDKFDPDMHYCGGSPSCIP